MQSKDSIKSRATRNMTPLMKMLVKSYMVKTWCDGDGVSFNWNWFNPLTVLLAPGMVVIAFALSVFYWGVYETNKNKSDFGIGLSDYWKARKNNRIFITPSDIH